VKVLLAAQPVDLRKSIDGLANIVRSGWHEDVYAGHLFVFVSRRRDRVKILTWDSGGFVVFYKRLEQGRFKLPSFHDDSLGAILGSADLSMLLDGIDLSHVRRQKKWSPGEQGGDRQMPGNLINTSRWHPARRARLSTSVNGARRRKPSRKSSRLSALNSKS
jgi:transposase